MSVQQTRWLLRAAAAALFAAAGAIAVWAFQNPTVVREAATGPGAGKVATRANVEQMHSPPLEQLQQVWQRQLRKSLFTTAAASEPEPAPETPADDPSETQRARRGIQLLGTMLEDGRSKAIFLHPNGKIDVKGSGEPLDLLPQTRVARIEPTRVTISSKGRRTVLQLPQSGAP